MLTKFFLRPLHITQLNQYVNQVGKSIRMLRKYSYNFFKAFIGISLIEFGQLHAALKLLLLVHIKPVRLIETYTLRNMSLKLRMYSMLNRIISKYHKPVHLIGPVRLIET